MAADSLKHNPGTYALIIALNRAQTIDIGRRGKFHFPAGFYLYAGSALGPGGLARRLERHLRAEKRLHWHVDFLLHAKHARIIDVWVTEGTSRHECTWANAATQLPEASIIVPRFGASDCHCAAHLAHLNTLPKRTVFAALAGDEVQSWKRK